MAEREAPPPGPISPIARQKARSYVRTFAADRTCAHPGCGTALSMYNRHPWCWQHTDPERRSRL
jgi:hypothetical protein